MVSRLKSGLVTIFSAGSLLLSSCDKTNNENNFERENNPKRNNVVYIEEELNLFNPNQSVVPTYAFNKKCFAFSQSYKTITDSISSSFCVAIPEKYSDEIGVKCEKLFLISSQDISLKRINYGYSSSHDFQIADEKDMNKILKIVRNFPSQYKNKFSENSKLYVKDIKEEDVYVVNDFKMKMFDISSEEFVIINGENKSDGLYLGVIGEINFIDKNSKKVNEKNLCHVFAYNSPYLKGYDGHWVTKESDKFMFLFDAEDETIKRKFRSKDAIDECFPYLKISQDEKKIFLDGEQKKEIIEIHKHDLYPLTYIHDGIREPLIKLNDDQAYLY